MFLLKRALAMAVAVAVAATLVTPAAAGKKQGPKPYTSEDGVIAVPHTLLYASTGEMNSVTGREFEARCAIPGSNGLDAYVYEVPKEYQAIDADIAAIGDAPVGWDLYIFFYDKDCKRNTMTVQAQGAVTESDAEGLMPKGTAYVLIADFAGGPATIHYELKPAS
jgi:hypothetical protein